MVSPVLMLGTSYTSGDPILNVLGHCGPVVESIQRSERFVITKMPAHFTGMILVDQSLGEFLGHSDAPASQIVVGPGSKPFAKRTAIDVNQDFVVVDGKFVELAVDLAGHLRTLVSQRFTL